MDTLPREMIVEIYKNFLPLFIPKIISRDRSKFIDGVTVERIHLGFDVILTYTNEHFTEDFPAIFYANYKIKGPDKDKILLGIYADTINKKIMNTDEDSMKRCGEFIEFSNGTKISRQKFRDVVDLLSSKAMNLIDEDLSGGAFIRHSPGDLPFTGIVFDKYITELY